MRDKPTNPQKQFEAARLLSASAGFKIFTPSLRYFKKSPHFLAARTENVKTLFLLRLNGTRLEIQFLGSEFRDLAHVATLEREIGITIKVLRALHRFTWDECVRFVIAPEHPEFSVLIHGTQLS